MLSLVEKFILKNPLKFIYSEKATKFCKIFTLLLSYVVPVKSKVKISQNFVAFSEYMNFNRPSRFVPCSTMSRVKSLNGLKNWSLKFPKKNNCYKHYYKRQFFFSIANWPKISPDLIFYSIKMVPCATSIYIMTLLLAYFFAFPLSLNLPETWGLRQK